MSFGPPLPDFNTLVSLHQQDPQAFEHFRRILLQEAIEAAPPAERPALLRLVALMDARRENAATPTDAMIAASRAMQDSLQQLLRAWGDARTALAEWQTATVLASRR